MFGSGGLEPIHQSVEEVTTLRGVYFCLWSGSVLPDCVLASKKLQSCIAWIQGLYFSQYPPWNQVVKYFPEVKNTFLTMLTKNDVSEV